MGSDTTGFEGTAGRLAGAVMARLNRDMEDAAIDELDPGAADCVLAVGFGPGVGIAGLLARLPGGLVAGIDPSSAMLEQARRRNRVAVDAGRACLVEAGAAAIPWPDRTFHGAVAVNSIQLWDPFDASLREVARVLAPGAALVTLTHRWAIERRAPVTEWTEATTAQLRDRGFEAVGCKTARYRSGEGVLLRARRSTSPCCGDRAAA